LKYSGAYRIVITQFVFAFIVLLVSAKPLVNYINHIVNHNDDDIELCEDFDEKDSSEEIIDFIFNEKTHLIIADITSIQKLSKNKSANKILQVFVDVPIPPPKQM